MDAFKGCFIAVMIESADYNAEKRKSDAGNYEAGQCASEGGAAVEAEGGRENQIACAEKDGKQHKADDESIFVH